MRWPLNGDPLSAVGTLTQCRALLPAGNRACICHHNLSAWLGKPGPESEIRSN